MGIVKFASVSICCAMLLACARQTTHIQILAHQQNATIKNLTSCGDSDPSIDIDHRRPLSIFVHGCNSSGGVAFRALARVFEFHGQQTICFDYDDRDSMEKSSRELIHTLNALSRHTGVGHMTVLGHSQGGLVARRAFVNDRKDGLTLTSDTTFRLVTISSPFAGVSASKHCGMPVLHLATLGITAGVCQAIAGTKWSELYPGADFMQFPGQLSSCVSEYLKVVTDERDTCLRYNEAGECLADDFVFSVAEQYNRHIDSDHRLTNVEIKAGHVEIVGNEHIAPKKLIAILQSNQILSQTPPGRLNDLNTLLSLIYRPKRPAFRNH